VWELYLLYPIDWLLALPVVWIKQQQPTPVSYIVTLTGKFNTNDAGAIAITFILLSNFARICQ